MAFRRDGPDLKKILLPPHDDTGQAQNGLLPHVQSPQQLLSLPERPAEILPQLPASAPLRHQLHIPFIHGQARKILGSEGNLQHAGRTLFHNNVRQQMRVAARGVGPPGSGVRLLITSRASATASGSTSSRRAASSYLCATSSRQQRLTRRKASERFKPRCSS